MTNRNRYLICYDIASPKRLHYVREAIKEFAVSGQKSFYECLMTTAEQKKMQQRLQKIINTNKDRIHIFQLDPRQIPKFFGKTSYNQTSSFIII